MLFRSKKQNCLNVESESSEYEDEFDVQTVYVCSINPSPREVFSDIKFHPKTAHNTSHKAKSSHIAQGKVDTGAMVSCLPLSILSDMGLSIENATPSKVVLRGASKNRLRNYGTLVLEVTCNNLRAKARFFITDNNSEILLGFDFCQTHELVTIADMCIQREITATSKSEHTSAPSRISTAEDVNAVHIMEESEADHPSLLKKWKKHLPLGKKTGDPLEDLKSIFPHMFDGKVGTFEGEVQLKVSPDAKPVQLPPRAVPQSMMSKLKTELDKMEREGIIRACPESTDWVHNLVLVLKKDDSIRVCLDPRNLNKYLIRSLHYTASWEDVQHSFKNGLYFSTLDAKSGYWTKRLSEESQLLTTFNTPFKKYCFQRLPFGLSVSAEIFCEQMDRALDGIPGTFPCADDVKVQGSTEERHDLHLLETVNRASEAGLKFNPNKCSIKQQKIEYFGRIITPQGVEPCPKKCRGIVKLAPPSDKQELQSLLGMVNFMSTFIPNLSRKTYLMRGLLKKDVYFTWTSDMQIEFDSIKQSIATATQLVHYDPSKPAVIETDASIKQGCDCPKMLRAENILVAQLRAYCEEQCVIALRVRYIRVIRGKVLGKESSGM